MSMTDPIADFLARIRNAIHSRRQTVQVASSNLKVQLAEVLKREGYIQGYAVTTDDKQGVIAIDLKYDRDNRCAIEGLRRVSRPGQRKYSKAEELPRIRNGLGIAVVTTSKGLMSDREARKQSLGGEVLCAIW
jgi:small subunit ribosomal protein S8